MADAAEKAQEEPKKQPTGEEIRASIEWAMKAVDPIITQLPDSYCKATFAINVVKRAMMDEATEALAEGLGSKHFEIMFEALCDKFSELVEDLPKDLERELRRHKKCDCLACMLGRAIDGIGKTDSGTEKKEHSTH